MWVGGGVRGVDGCKLYYRKGIPNLNLNETSRREGRGEKRGEKGINMVLLGMAHLWQVGREDLRISGDKLQMTLTGKNKELRENIVVLPGPREKAKAEGEGVVIEHHIKPRRRFLWAVSVWGVIQTLSQVVGSIAELGEGVHGRGVDELDQVRVDKLRGIVCEGVRCGEV